MNLLLKEHLENLLISNWSKFIDLNKLKFICSQEGDKFDISNIKIKKINNFQFKASHVELTSNGFKIWIDFCQPKNNRINMGTIELSIIGNHMLHTGSVGNSFMEEA